MRCQKEERGQGEEAGIGGYEKQPRTLNSGSEVELWNLFQQKKIKLYFPLSLTQMEFDTMKINGTPAQILTHSAMIDAFATTVVCGMHILTC